MRGWITRNIHNMALGLIGAIAGALVMTALYLPIIRDLPKPYRQTANPPLTTRALLLDGRPVLHPEVAFTEAQYLNGLSHRDAIGAAGGMAFPLDRPSAEFWMRNTRFPLDLVFVGRNGIVGQISRGRPMDDSRIDYPHPVSFVLELPAGDAKRLGIHTGSTLSISKIP